VAERLPLTLDLALAGLCVACVLGTTMGAVAAALTQNGNHPVFEAVFVRVTGGLGVLPEIAIGTALVAVFAAWLRLVPVSGVQGLGSLVLPALAIGVRPSFNLARVVRAEMHEVLKQQYMQTAASKRIGLVRQYVVHALPNAMTAILTLFGLLFAHIVGGVVVIESLFAWPGIGSALVNAVLDRDYPVVQALIALLGFIVIVTNLLIDLLIGLFDKQSVIGNKASRAR
jgi:peptide/nickel transport system permease protein